MKTKLLFMSAITFFFFSLSYGQGHRNTSYTYVGNGSDYSGGHHDGQHDSGYDRYERYYDRMSRRDRKCLSGLVNKLENRERDAWRNGHLSDREVRRIREVEEDISRLLSRYQRHERRTYDREYRHKTTSCR